MAALKQRHLTYCIYQEHKIVCNMYCSCKLEGDKSTTTINPLVQRDPKRSDTLLKILQ